MGAYALVKKLGSNYFSPLHLFNKICYKAGERVGDTCVSKRNYRQNNIIMRIRRARTH